MRVDGPGVTLLARTPRPLMPADRELLEALVAGLAAGLDRLRLQEEVRDARLVAEVGRQRAGFLSAVSHNLRTPLTAVKAAAGTLLSSWSRIEPEERRELLETISDEAERLERLVRNTLELSRIRAGALEIEPERVDIADLVQHAVRRLRPIARAHRVRLDVDDDLPPVSLDVTMAEQILLNLLENALRFAPPGSEIVVGAHALPHDAAVVTEATATTATGATGATRSSSASPTTDPGSRPRRATGSSKSSRARRRVPTARERASASRSCGPSSSRTAGPCATRTLPAAAPPSCVRFRGRHTPA